MEKEKKQEFLVCKLGVVRLQVEKNLKIKELEQLSCWKI